MTINSGVAREVAPGRLTNFEDSDDAGGGITLPPRRRRTGVEESASATSTAAPHRTSISAPTPDPQDASEVPFQGSGGLQPAADAPLAEKGAKGPEDRVRASNVHIPVALLEPLTAKCKAEGLSHGEILIVAIEAAYPQLQELIHPRATAGGALFASRRSRASRAADGPLTPLNYRLREGDYATLDQLVEEFGASSRGQLITAALTYYFRAHLTD